MGACICREHKEHPPLLPGFGRVKGWQPRSSGPLPSACSVACLTGTLVQLASLWEATSWWVTREEGGSSLRRIPGPPSRSLRALLDLKLKPWGPSPTRNANILTTQLKSLGREAWHRVSTDFCRFSPRLRLTPRRAAAALVQVLCVPGSYLPCCWLSRLGYALFLVSWVWRYIPFQMGSKLVCYLSTPPPSRWYLLALQLGMCLVTRCGRVTKPGIYMTRE